MPTQKCKKCGNELILRERFNLGNVRWHLEYGERRKREVNAAHPSLASETTATIDAITVNSITRLASGLCDHCDSKQPVEG